MNTENTLAAKLARAMGKCAYVQKDKQNDFHRYKYASAAAIAAEVNPALAAEGIAVTARVEILRCDEVKNAKGATERLWTVKVTLKLSDGTSSMETEGIGSGQDVADKGVMKAQTAASKYAWQLALCISTGDDPEEDEQTDRNAHHEPERPAAAPARSSKSNGVPPANASTDEHAEIRARFATAKGSEWAPLAKKVDEINNSSITNEFAAAVAKVLKRQGDQASLSTARNAIASTFPKRLVDAIAPKLDLAVKERLTELNRPSPDATSNREPGQEG